MRILLRRGPLRAVDPDVVDPGHISLFVSLAVLAGEDSLAHSEGAVRDHKFRLYIHFREEFVLQSRDSIRDHDRRSHAGRNVGDHILGLARHKSPDRRKLLIGFIYLDDSCVDHVKCPGSDILHVRSDVYGIHARHGLSVGEYIIVSECRVSYGLEGIRKVERAQVQALIKRHVPDRLKGLRKDHPLDHRIRESAIADLLGAFLDPVFPARRTGVLDQKFPVLCVQNAVHGFIGRVVTAELNLF